MILAMRLPIIQIEEARRQVTRRSYRFLNRDIKAAATRLEKGQLILNHAVFREPVKIKFPAITCDRRRLGECSAMIL